MEVVRKEVCQWTDPDLCWLQVAISNTGCRLVSEKCINASSSYYTDPFMVIRWKHKCLLEETKRSRQEAGGARCEVRSCRMWLVIRPIRLSAKWRDFPPGIRSHPRTISEFPSADNVPFVSSDHRTKQAPMGRASLVFLAEPRPLYHAEAPCEQGSLERDVQRPHQASSLTEPD